MLGFIYGVVSYLAFFGSFSCFALFTDGLVAFPRAGDGSPTAAVLVDVGLMLLFGLQHSIMARAAFKRVLTRVVPAALERSTYVLASSAVLILPHLAVAAPPDSRSGPSASLGWRRGCGWSMPSGGWGCR